MKWQKWTGILKLSHKWEHKWEHKWSISFNLSCNSQVTHALGGVSECLKISQILLHDNKDLSRIVTSEYTYYQARKDLYKFMTKAII